MPSFSHQLEHVQLAFQRGQLQQALKLGAELETRFPGQAPLKNLLGGILYQGNQPEAALAKFNEALALDSGQASIYLNRGAAQAALGRTADARRSFLLAVELNPQLAGAWFNLGNVQRQLEDWQSAKASYLRAVEIDPDMAMAWHNLAGLHKFAGQRADAIHCYEQALKCQPALAEAHRNLSTLKTYETGDPQLTAIERLLDKGATPAAEKQLYFALGKAHEDLGNYQQSFHCYSRANTIRRQELGYSLQTDLAQLALVRKRFEALRTLLQTAPGPGSDPCTGPTPILVVGMPRSGTSLVERILDGHSQVRGCGELEALTDCSRRLLSQPLPQDTAQARAQLGEFASAYLGTLASQSGDSAYAVDKMPGNLRWLGFLLLGCPQVRVISMQRDPVATCWSNFRHYFTGRGNGFSCDLQDLATYYQAQQAHMAFWKDQFDEQILECDYEALTEAPESRARELLRFCGLDWEPGCLDLQHNNATVKTASALQVRKSVYTGSSRAWRKFRPWLGDLVAAFNPPD